MTIHSIFEEMGISLSDTQTKQFQKYFELLIAWNEKINLTSITEYEDVLVKHFADSVSMVKGTRVKEIHEALIEGKEASLLDIGTGAGFPAIPLKIAFPNLKVTMIDSLNKRVKFLNLVIEELGLTGIEAYHGRAEEYATPDKFREQFDFVVSRAVANLSTLLEYCLPYVKVGGKFIAYKSEDLPNEMATAGNALQVLGGRKNTIVNFMLPESDYGRNLLVVDKVSATPKKYPRKAGTPKEKPL